MSTKLTSTTAKVRDPQKVSKIFASYEVRGAEVELHEEKEGWVLDMAFKDESYDGWEWPAALHRDQWPIQEEYADEDDWYDELDRRFDDQGDEGFLALLRDLAPTLETQLLILVAVRESAYSSARAWTVQPETREIQTLRIDL